MGSAMKLFKSLSRKDGDGKRARGESASSPETSDGQSKRAKRTVDVASTSAGSGSGQSTPPGSKIKPMSDASASFITSSVRKTSTVRKTGAGIAEADRVPPMNLAKTFGAGDSSDDDNGGEAAARNVLASPSGKLKRSGSRKILDTIFSPMFSFFSSGGTQKTSKTRTRKAKKAAAKKAAIAASIDDGEEIDIDVPPIPSMHASIASMHDIDDKHVELLGGELMSAREYLERFGMTPEEAAFEPDEEYDEEYDPWAFIHNLKYSDPRDYVRPKRGPVLALRARDEFPNTLVLDLDETLVHSNLENTEEPFDFSFPVLFNGQDHEVRVAKRPHLETFMDFVSERFEIVVFTASQRVYADKLLDVLDPENKWFKHRIFRDSCVSYEGNFMKDLTVLGRDLKKTIIIDNSPQAFSLQVDNGIPIESWYDDQTDNHLLSLLPILDELCRAEDVRDVLRQTFNLQERVRRGGLRSSASRRAARDMLAQF